jgi:uncharacterized protein VirK/YbjX
MTVSKTLAAGPSPGVRQAAGAAPSIGRLWQWSDRVCEQKGWRRLKARVGFVVKARRVGHELAAFDAGSSGSLARAMALRPEITGAAVWPYVCATWSAERRLRQIREHFQLVDSIGGKLDFPMDQSMQVLDLSELQPGLKVVLDQPRWFMREGQLVLNLFAGDVRIYSIAFSLGRDGERTIAYIGAIQGGNTDGVMADYKDLTKTLHGMRPRDFLVELLRTLCRVLGVSRILAVADERRQHRASYFGNAKAEVLSLNYDDIWAERGAVRENDEFFALAIEAPLKSLDEIPSKKRAMYRRRYELLDSLEAAIAATLAGQAQPPLVRSGAEPSA